MVGEDKIFIFTDGACRGNPGPGGWGAIVAFFKDDSVIEAGGHKDSTTNNQMELEALIQALTCVENSKQFTELTAIHIGSDSKYVLDGCQRWIKGWKTRGWKKADGEEIKNLEQWKKLDELLSLVRARLNWHHVEGHTGHSANERVDEIATTFADSTTMNLYKGNFENYNVELHMDHETSTSKPYYISLVGGDVVKHTTWQDCFSRVEGISGARYKKVRNEIEERKVLDSWGIHLK